jgi:hypothetical protein
MRPQRASIQLSIIFGLFIAHLLVEKIQSLAAERELTLTSPVIAG